MEHVSIPMDWFMKGWEDFARRLLGQLIYISLGAFVCRILQVHSDAYDERN